MKTGDRVTLGYEGETVPATIALASANGRSLMLEFEAILGGHVGSMPVLCGDDGEYRSIITGQAVTVQRV